MACGPGSGQASGTGPRDVVTVCIPLYSIHSTLQRFMLHSPYQRIRPMQVEVRLHGCFKPHPHTVRQLVLEIGMDYPRPPPASVGMRLSPPMLPRKWTLDEATPTLAKARRVTLTRATDQGGSKNRSSTQLLPMGARPDVGILSDRT